MNLSYHGGPFAPLYGIYTVPPLCPLFMSAYTMVTLYQYPFRNAITFMHIYLRFLKLLRISSDITF